MAKKTTGTDSTDKPKKTTCPVTRAEFRQHAKPLNLAETFNGRFGEVKEFSTGSLGWGWNDKMTVTLNGQQVKLQVSLNLTIIGSKELPQS